MVHRKKLDFASPHKMPGPMKIPQSINGVEDRGRWGQLMQEHIQQMYHASEEERERTWTQLAAVHHEAFQEGVGEFVCYPEDLVEIKKVMPGKKAAGGDGLPSQILKSFSKDQIAYLAKTYQKIANSPAHAPQARPQIWNIAAVALIAKTSNP